MIWKLVARLFDEDGKPMSDAYYDNETGKWRFENVEDEEDEECAGNS